MAYCSTNMLESGVRNIIEAAGDQPDHHLILDQHWPLSQINYRDEITRIAKLTNAKVYDAGRNLGGTDGITYLAKKADELGCGPDDLIAYCDPDQNVLVPGWLTAMKEVMQADPKIGVLCAWPFQQMRTDFTETEVAGHKLRLYPGADMFSCHVWRRGFMGDKVEGEFKWYGQIEIPAYRRAQRLGMYLAWMPDFKEAPCTISHDKRYTRWKALHVSNAFNGDFAQYLKEHS